jgi:Ala-tRNA(Pro) deacylase
MPVTKVLELLESSGVSYETLEAPAAFTAQQTAEEARIPGRELAKTVVVKIDGAYAMAVLPAPARIDFALLAGVAGSIKVELATEEEFAELFPDCEVGAMPPFGNLYGLKVYVEEDLAQDERISFYGCSHDRLIRMAYKDYARLVSPQAGRFSQDRVATMPVG